MKILRCIVTFLFIAVASAWAQAQPPSGSVYGLFLLDSHHWAEAAQEFGRIAAKGGAQGEEALYWKAYALNKAERPVEALAAVAELRKAYPVSRWLPDAAALEMEIKQGAGQSVKPENLPDEELKLLALNSVMRSDPERAVPTVESLLKEAHSLALKREALYVLAQSDSPKAQELLEWIARGGMNAELKTTDLQVTAVRYLAQQKRPQGKLAQTLFEIYNSTSDADVKREAVNGLTAIGDTVYLRQISTPEARQAMLATALERLQQAMQANRARAMIVADYQAQQDRTAKQGIIDAQQKNGTALIAIARVETDPYFKKRIVEHLIDLNTPEAKEYLLEILK